MMYSNSNLNCKISICTCRIWWQQKKKKHPKLNWKTYVENIWKPWWWTPTLFFILILKTVSLFVDFLQSRCPGYIGGHERWETGQDHLHVPGVLQRLPYAQGVQKDVWSAVSTTNSAIYLLNNWAVLKLILLWRVT